MRSTGEVMGVSERFSIAFAKAQLAGGTVLPTEGKIFLSVSKRDKDAAVDIARRLAALGHEVVATEGTAQRLEVGGIGVTRVRKLSEGRPNVLDLLNDGQIGLVINTPSGKGARTDEGRIRAAAVQLGVSCITTLQAAEAAVKAMEALREEEMSVQALQDRFPKSPVAEVTGQEVLT
jgi:carbamoyl-phosphate synthase large subunit